MIFALGRLNWDANLILASYSSILLLMNLPSLANRRLVLGTVSIYNLTRGKIDSSDLVSQLNFSVPRRLTRNYIHLVLNHCRSNYDLHEPFRVLFFDYNRLTSTEFDNTSLFFYASMISRIRAVRKYCILFRLSVQAEYC